VKTNLQTWTRLRRLRLQELSIGLGNGALAAFKHWPTSGEGRQVKAATERLTALLDSTHDRDVHHAFDRLDGAMAELRLIADNPFFRRVLAGQVHQSGSTAKRTFGELVDNHITEFDEFVTAHRPTKVTEASQSDGIRDPDISSDDLGRRLLEVTPAQQNGPLKFEFREGRLHIKHEHSQPSEKDLQNVRAARDALATEGAVLVQHLIDSNCDQRLTEIVQDIHAKIIDEVDVINLGIVNLSCSQMASRFEAELPDVISARLEGFSVGVSLFVGQYEAWQRFVENAASVDYDLADIREVYEAGVAFLPHLRSSPGLVDPEVPRSVEWVLEAISNPRRSSKRALFGAVRTLENLIARIFTEFAGLLGSVTEGARTGTKRAVSVIAAGLLLGAAANAALNLSPAVGRIVKVDWLEKAAKIVRKGLNEAD